MLYEITDLKSARRFFIQTKSKVVLSNITGSTRYYGMRVIDYFFKTLKKEFPDKISEIIVNVADDYSAFVTAEKLGYQKIKHS